MTERGSVRLGSTTLDYCVVRSRRRKKTVEITIDPDGILVAAPADTPTDRIRAVVIKRARWIVQHDRPETHATRQKQFVSGESLPYLGRQVRIFLEEGTVDEPTVKFQHWAFHFTVPRSTRRNGRAELVRAAARDWYRSHALQRLRARVAVWAPVLGVSPVRTLTGDQRQRWGSCSPDGTLRFNWRIVMAEPALIDYVVVHELAHLIVRTHTPAYWATVARVMPDYKLRRRRLREAGPELAV